ncbi:SET domain-containing protein [Aulographum hederae CBS 113979]|uniref:SET domain-containing protein n=1 Tax=Aulographum hederae CBS 113979 TaxID=1176131 RepID=A0A6G1GT18_9PEZI|nr:SET domain-containing protein [Aulographum hederae CBS 113979]
MIRRGRADGWLRLPVAALKPWASFNGVKYDGIRVAPLAGYEDRGSTVIAERRLEGGSEGPLMVVPRDLVLSLEFVQSQLKVDKNLREALEALGDFGRTARGAILTFLLHQATIACPEATKSVGVITPFLEYIKFLPDELLPTFWNQNERDLLVGTTLKPAVDAKLSSLNREFENLRAATEHISWCQKNWWNEEEALISFDDWLHVDAMFRSRALDFPGIGDSMVPCIDMANHSSGDATAALYETDGQGNAVLLLRDGKNMDAGHEISITYGDKKGACEMIFSYGFVEDGSSAKELFLELDMPDDDPLSMAKKAISTVAPGVRLYEHQDTIQWDSEYIWLVCVNEEDGLEFQVLQTVDGSRELKAFWKEEELLDVSRMKDLLQSDERWDVFQLRAAAIIQARVESQLTVLYSTDKQDTIKTREDALVREIPYTLATTLRKLETAHLERAYGELEKQKLDLLQSSTVQEYLGLAGANEAGDADDFS